MRYFATDSKYCSFVNHMYSTRAKRLRSVYTGYCSIRGITRVLFRTEKRPMNEQDTPYSISRRNLLALLNIINDRKNR